MATRGIHMGEATVAKSGLLKLQAWLSPSFPIGGFSYSHGLEEAVLRGDVADTGGLFTWTDTALRFGGGRVDAILLAESWRAAAAGQAGRLIEAAELGRAMRGTAELALESTAQGEAFLETARAAWPGDAIEKTSAELEKRGISPVLPVAVGLVSAGHGVSLEAALPMYLQSFTSGIVSAGVRLVPLGQTDGQRVVARLQPVVESAAESAISADFRNIGAAAPMIDLASMAHETRDGRLFRS